ncbi:Two-component transcriptional response regulator, LuxR family [hydrothermal vent metagenome]|uniref:Two-component transcriptional response regulator, LuxR family n=1 Tax=hydrothermal vent metagenome TaxID=652676 RepID=A0A3B0X4W2_9ZZZZ
MSQHIAIVEDEPAIRENYADAFKKLGYKISLYSGREEAVKAFELRLPDLALLDIGLEDDVEGGFEICRVLRSKSTTVPIIFLTARDSDLDIISGLRLGADDYLTKDISLPNLCARVAALFRRINAITASPAEEEIFERGYLRMDMNRFVVDWKEKRVDLTLTELWVVHTLAKHPGHVKNREQLMEDARIVVDDATITSHIKRIRNKFIKLDTDFESIETVYGMGYRWLER